MVDALTAGETSSVDAKELQIRRGFLLAWSTDVRQEIQMRSPNTNIATSTRRIKKSHAVPVTTAPTGRKQ